MTGPLGLKRPPDPRGGRISFTEDRSKHCLTHTHKHDQACTITQYLHFFYTNIAHARSNIQAHNGMDRAKASRWTKRQSTPPAQSGSTAGCSDRERERITGSRVAVTGGRLIRITWNPVTHHSTARRSSSWGGTTRPAATWCPCSYRRGTRSCLSQTMTARHSTPQAQRLPSSAFQRCAPRHDPLAGLLRHKQA